MSPAACMFAAAGRSRQVMEPAVASMRAVAAWVVAAVGRSRSRARGGAHSPSDREISIKSAVGVSLRRRPAFGPREPRETRGT